MPARDSRRLPWLAGLAVLAVALPALLVFHQRHPLLYDTDSSYHLAVARLTAQQRIVRELPAIRYSLLTEHGFTDSVLLFHLALAPFAAGADPTAGGRHALALLDALILAALAALACRAVGWWGLLAPLGIGVGSLEVAWRLARLRPELLGLLLLLGAVAAAGAQRYRLLGVLAALYALAYVAWHAFAGLFVLLFLFRGWARRRWDWPLLLYPLLGSGLGLLLHPAFPANLLLWKLASVDVLATRPAVDVGSELGPNPVNVVVLANLGFWALAFVCWRSRRPAGPESASDHAVERELADAFGVAAACFGVLYLSMSRFSLYAFPFAGLWLLFELAARGEEIGPRLRLPFRGSLPAGVGLAAAALLSLPGSAQELARFARRTDPGPRQERWQDRRAFARALPAGAKVAAPWGDTATYLLWAPQGRYLNVLDPNAMAVPYPRRYAAQRAIFSGEEPDVPLAAVTELDSAYVAWSLPGAPPRLLARLAGDPRAGLLHRGFQALFAIAPAPGSFLLDWRVVLGGAVPPATAPRADWPAYPRHPDPQARAIEGFVDAGRVAPGRCVAFVREGSLADGRYELAAAGPTKLWQGDELVLALGGEGGAVLGQGATFAPRPRTGGGARVTVLTCPDGKGRAGFYLLRRE